jgi:signal transduction histidine kinase
VSLVLALYGDDISVESHAGSGSIFTMRIPILTPSAHGAAADGRTVA